MKPRVLVDTSTLVSAAFRVDSKPHQALTIALERYELCVCAQTLKELGSVLARPKFLRYAPAEALQAFVDLVQTEGQMFAVTAEDEANIAPRCRDRNDDILLALAKVAKVDVLVASDNDLLALHPWNRIPILTPAQFLAQHSA
jgi:uncharacterized protein